MIREMKESDLAAVARLETGVLYLLLERGTVSRGAQ